MSDFLVRSVVSVLVWWVRVRTLFGYNIRGGVRVPGLCFPSVVRGMMRHPCSREWVLSFGYKNSDRLRAMAVWSVILSPHLTKEDWSVFFRDFPALRVPALLLSDERVPSWIAVECLNGGIYGSYEVVERLTDRREVREQMIDFLWRKCLWDASTVLTVRGLLELSSVSNSDLGIVLNRRDKGSVVVEYLLKRGDGFSAEQWCMLLNDRDVSMQVVQDSRMPESVLHYFLASPYSSVLTEMARQNRLSESMRIAAALGA